MWNQARAAATLAIVLASAPFAVAQTQSPTQSQPEQGAKPDASAPAAKPDAGVPEEKLDKAAAAIGQVVALKQTYTQRLQAAPEGERQQIADEAKTALTKAVTDQGLSVEEYSNILQVAENDNSVRDKILQRIRQKAAD